MFERFTDRARKTLALANQEAMRLHNEYIGTQHILLGLLREGTGVAADLLNNLGVDLEAARVAVQNRTAKGPESPTFGKLPQTPRAKMVVTYAIQESEALKHNYVGTEHLLLGLMRDPQCKAAATLESLGVDLDTIRRELLMILGAGFGSGPAEA